VFDYSLNLLQGFLGGQRCFGFDRHWSEKVTHQYGFPFMLSSHPATPPFPPRLGDMIAPPSPLNTLPRTTLAYKTISEGLDIHIDVWAPLKSAYQDGHGTLTPRPAFVYFHGGGLAVGAREVWIPEWLFSESYWLYFRTRSHLVSDALHFVC
jgi:acetyl esterase/lipase